MEVSNRFANIDGSVSNGLSKSRVKGAMLVLKVFALL
jgi:hypothetical protein